MKAFALAVVAIIGIGVGTWAILGNLGMSSSQVYSTSNVRQ